MYVGTTDKLGAIDTNTKYRSVTRFELIKLALAHSTCVVPRSHSSNIWICIADNLK